MLSYAVTQALEGRNASLKESVLGVTVFGRKPGYDSGAHSIVRVEFNRLRKREWWRGQVPSHSRAARTIFAASGQPCGLKRRSKVSLRRQGDVLRVHVQLVNAKDGCHPWAARYERRIIDVFQLQEEIAVAIVSAASVWAYRHRPAVNGRLLRRQRSLTLSDETKRIAWRAQQRLYKRYAALMARGQHKNQVVTALARELLGFVWAIAMEAEAKFNLKKAA